MILIKVCREHSTVCMCVHYYTSGIDSYNALQKQGIFLEAMVLAERAIQRSKIFKHDVSNLFDLQTPPIAPPIAQHLPLSSQFLI